MFVEYIWTVQLRNGTLKHSETETFHFNWKNKTFIETELTTLLSSIIFSILFINLSETHQQYTTVLINPNMYFQE